MFCAQYTKVIECDVQIYRVPSPPLPSVTVQDVVPPHRMKNKHTLDKLRGKCPMIVPVSSQSWHIDLERCVAYLIHSSTSPAASHIS